MHLQSDAALAQSLSVDRFKTRPGRLLSWNGVFAEYGRRSSLPPGRLTEEWLDSSLWDGRPRKPPQERVSDLQTRAIS
jgi:hypothetical protein